MWAKAAGGQHPPLLSQHESPEQHPTVLRGTENTESSPFTTVSFFLSSLCERVRVCWRALAYTWRGCFISSGFSPYHPLKWAQNRILSCHYARDWLCWQQTFFMQNIQKQSTVQQERSRQISLAMKTAIVRTVFPSFSNKISRSKFRMCCGTNACSLLCHLYFNRSPLSSSVMPQCSSSLLKSNTKIFIPIATKHGKPAAYFIKSLISIAPNSERACQVR